MGKKRPKPRLSTFLQEIYGLYNQVEVKSGELIDWADKEFYGKNYEDAFKELLEDSDYEVLDEGKIQNGSFKKIIQYRANPLVKVIFYHDKNGVVNTTLIETIH